MATASVKLTLDNAEFMAKMAKAQESIARFGAAVRGVALAAAGAVVAIGGIYGVTEGIGKAIEEASNFEKLEVSFATLLNNTKAAKSLLAGLTQFAATTPFQLNDVASSGKQLLAYGFAAKDIIPTLRMLGDVSSGLDIPLSELVETFGKNIVQGRLFQRDILQFQSRGIPIVAELAKQFGVTEQEVSGLVEAGKVGSAELMKAFQSLTGPGSKFGGMMAEQSKTFSGMVSNLKDAFDGLFRDFGKPLIDALKPVIAYINDNMDALRAKAAEWGQFLARAIGIAFEAFRQGRVTEIIGLAITIGATRGFNEFLRLGSAAIAGVGAALQAVFDGFEGKGPLAMLGDAQFWINVGLLAASVFNKVAMTFGDVLNDALNGAIREGTIRDRAGFTQIGGLLTGQIIDDKTAYDFAAEDYDRERKQDRRMYDEAIATSGASLMNYVNDFSANAPALGEKISSAISAAYKNASIVPALDAKAKEATAKLVAVFGELDATAQKAVDALKPAEKIGPVTPGKNFLEESTAQGKGFDIIASSLAKVGGGGYFAVAGPQDALLKATNAAAAATDRNTAAVMDNTRAVQNGRNGSEFTLKRTR